MNEIDLIKRQIKKLRDISDNQNPIVTEHIKTIKKNYLIVEDDSPRDIERYNVPNSTEQEIEDQEGLKDDVSQGYRISGGVLVIHGDNSQDVELTTDDKTAFQETMDEFVAEVSDLVNFGQLNIYKNNVDWSGLIVDFDTEFYFTIGESNGIYMSGEMIKVDENFLGMVSKLQTYYEKFKSKWAKILASRKKTTKTTK
jgi:predicted transcriptional regulator